MPISSHISTLSVCQMSAMIFITVSHIIIPTATVKFEPPVPHKMLTKYLKGHLFTLRKRHLDSFSTYFYNYRNNKNRFYYFLKIATIHNSDFKILISS